MILSAYSVISNLYIYLFMYMSSKYVIVLYLIKNKSYKCKKAFKTLFIIINQKVQLNLF